MDQSPLVERGDVGRSVNGAATQRRRLGTAEHQLQVIFRTSFEALLVLDDERRFLHVNDAGAMLLGASLESVLTRRLEDFTPGEHWAALMRFWANLQKRGSLHGSHQLLKDDGSRRAIELRAAWDFGPGQHLIAGRATGPRRNSAGGRAPRKRGALTPREQAVLQLAADGCSPPEIARVLLVSPGTVKTHFQHIYRKLGAHDRASAVAKGLRGGLIS
jgi:PAS domain S-box-containing protein